jgi:hypothetical protein
MIISLSSRNAHVRILIARAWQSRKAVSLQQSFDSISRGLYEGVEPCTMCPACHFLAYAGTNRKADRSTVQPQGTCNSEDRVKGGP